MASKGYSYYLTETAEADVDEEKKAIIVLRVVYGKRNQDQVLKNM